MRWGFYWIREWDGTVEMVRAEFLGHKTVLAPNMVRINYCDGAVNKVTEDYFYSLVVRMAYNSEINPM